MSEKETNTETKTVMSDELRKILLQIESLLLKADATSDRQAFSMCENLYLCENRKLLNGTLLYSVHSLYQSMKSGEYTQAFSTVQRILKNPEDKVIRDFKKK